MGPGGARTSAFQRLGSVFPERSDSLSGSEACEGAYGALLTLGASLEGSQVEAAEREVRRLQAQEEATLGKGMLQVAMPRYLAPARPPARLPWHQEGERMSWVMIKEGGPGLSKKTAGSSYFSRFSLQHPIGSRSTARSDS